MEVKINIFYLDPDPVQAARYHCDQHVLKMIIEYAQMMSTAHRMLDGDETIIEGKKRWTHPEWDHLLYKVTHRNHPSSVWTRSSRQRYWWVYKCWRELCDIYHEKSGRRHATDVRLRRALVLAPKSIPSVVWDHPPLCMPEECVVNGFPTASYRLFYVQEKSKFARWKYNDKPWWYTLGQEMKEELNDWCRRNSSTHTDVCSASNS